jgi:hypothetical protein
MTTTATCPTKDWLAAMNRYVTVNKRTFPQILNSKGLFASLGAFGLTKKADPASIKRTLGEIVTVQSGTFSRGKRKGQARTVRSAIAIRSDSNHQAPLAALIIAKSRAARGLPEIQGEEMKKAIIKMIGSRNRAVGFLASGALPAIRKFGAVASKAGAPAVDRRSARQIGRDKGAAVLATENKLEAQIINNATTKTDLKNALFRYFGPAMDQSIRNETASMNKYCEDRLKPAVDQFNRRN